MPGPFTVVTFKDADGDEFPITLIGHYQTTEDAIAEANGVLTKAIWEGQIRPRKPITLASPEAYEWGGGQ
jgi:hypothetical protein